LTEPIEPRADEDAKGVFDAIHSLDGTQRDERLQQFRDNAIDEKNDNDEPAAELGPSCCVDYYRENDECREVKADVTPGKAWDFRETDHRGGIGYEQYQGEQCPISRADQQANDSHE
jgi:hypothetical protein